MEISGAVDHTNLAPSTVHRLASLDVAIHECGLKMPFPINVGSDSTATRTRNSTLFALDELFRLTTEFLDILTSLCDVASPLNLMPCSTIPLESNTESVPPLFRYSQRLSETVQSAGLEESNIPFPLSDEASIFMVFSCHGRLTEIYVCLFVMMQACIEHSLLPRRAKDWAIVLPQLRVGSVALPPVYVDVDTPVSSATSSMYMLMITMLSSQLWARLADMMRVGDATSVRMGSRFLLMETVWDSVTAKNNCILQTIETTRYLLQRHCVTA
jgi:hypothetical protein